MKMDISKIFTTPQLYILLFTVAAAFAAAISAYKDNITSEKIDNGVSEINNIVTNSETKLNEASKKLEDNNILVGENLKKTLKANEQLENNYKQIVATLNESIEAKNTTIEAQKQILGQITGGESYPKITLKKDGFFLTVVGAYNIPGLKVKIGLIQNCLNIPENITTDYFQGKADVAIFNVEIQKEYSKLWTVPFSQSIKFKNMKDYLTQDNNQLHGFEIYFESTYKKWAQKIRIIAHNGNWEIADVLYEIPTIQKDNNYSSEKEIYEHVSKDFPSLSGAEPYKLVPFFNKSPHNQAGALIIPIKYNHDNGISNYSFDYFTN